MQQKPLKILFVIRSAEHFIYYRSIVEELLNRGHEVLFLHHERWSEPGSDEKLIDFRKSRNKFYFAKAIARRDTWRNFLFYTRELLSYRSYLLGERRKLRRFYRERWKSYLPNTLQSIFNWKIANAALASSPAGWALKAFEKVAPPDAKIAADIKKHNPDVVIVSPANMRFSSAELEYLKAAKYLNIPTALPVISWDNLTNKGYMHIAPDRLLVWNAAHKSEAMLHHNIPGKNISIIGAPVFDQWFLKLKASQSRSAFCRQYGLNEKSPIIAYLGSSANIAQDESWVIKDLRRKLYENEELKNTQIIIRPHPGSAYVYENLNLHNVVVLPKNGGLPDTEGALDLFYDTLYFSVCAVGINTSGMIDAIIAGKPCIAFMPKEYEDSQLQTKHFLHLFESGALEAASTAQEFTSVFEGLLRGQDVKKRARENFVQKFIRPNGINISAGKMAADEIEKLCAKN